jgi:hypothetical protein
MNSSETLNMEIVVNKLSFPLVTYTAYSVARFDSYKILKSRQGAECFLNS